MKAYFLTGLISVLSLTAAMGQTATWGYKPIKLEEGLSQTLIKENKLYLVPNKAWDTDEVSEVAENLTSVTKRSYSSVRQDSKFGSEFDKKAGTLTITYQGKEIAIAKDLGHTHIGWSSVSNPGGGTISEGKDFGYSGKTVKSSLSEISDMPYSVNYDYYFFGDYMQVSLFQSPDKKNNLLVYRKKPASKNDKVNKDVYVFQQMDENFKLKNETEIQINYTESEIFMNAFGITNSGQVFYVAKYLASGEKSKSEEAPYVVKVGLVDVKGGKFGKEININTKGKWLRSISVTVEGNGMSINSLYSNSAKTAGLFIDGALSSKVDFENINASVELNPFGGNILHTWETSSSKYMGSQPRVYGIQSINLEKDGITYVIAVSHTFTGAGDNAKTYTYSEGIVLLKTSLDGKKIFSTKINRQLSETGMPKAGNVFIHKYNNSYYLLYCIGKSQVNIDLNTEPERTYVKDGKFLIMCSKIDSQNGEMNTVAVSDELTSDQIPLFDEAQGSDDGKIYLIEAKNSEVYYYNFGSQLAKTLRLGVIKL